MHWRSRVARWLRRVSVSVWVLCLALWILDSRMDVVFAGRYSYTGLKGGYLRWVSWGPLFPEGHLYARGWHAYRRNLSPDFSLALTPRLHLEHDQVELSTRFIPLYAEVPLFLLVLLTSAATAFILWRTRTQTTASRLCLMCGYDLTGNVSGACPECGSSVGVDQRIGRNPGS